ncbi:Hypothetical protein I595_2118 [Croceitalea dokdonensis DOKDO 023]|uniref:DUF11 domain-containing protein n=2 Tax=Croceitalea TaxID=574891 RepID=A0A0P7AT90_9FLAO|nr:Hypothetical protein I595_2118 [Croceitalea dokdonensis DOKDO 023]
MGQNFKWGGVPNLGTHSSKSNTLGIMATEDNTTITLSGYNPDCTFRLGSDSDGITDNSYQIILDENESFVFEAYLGNTFSLAQSEGWIGASVNSDKDIVISNGMLNYGRQANATNRDAGMDQPVPEDRLGKEYVFVRAGGTDANEFPIIIATQNNTQIFVNGALTPMATINSGEFFMVPGSNYSSSTPGANMYVRVSKDAYAYQNIAGSTGIQTAGLNFVAPLNCLIPDTVNNIPDITDAANTTLTGGITIIASTTTPDSNIVVTDGTGIVTMPASNSVAGNSDWKTFYIPNLSGNVDVQSTGPIAVGFFGVNSNRGIAGYFSGFDVAPNVDLQITGTQCLPGASLEIIGEVFDAYQWYGDGELIVGATNTTYNPTVAGDYFVRVTKGPCTYDSNTLAAYYCDPDIELIKTADATTINEGETVTFTITVQNYAVDPATNLVVTDVLPAGLTLVSATPSTGSWSSPNWTIGTLTSGTLETINITAIADSNNTATQSQWVANIATNNQDQVDSNITPDLASVAVIINNDFDADGVMDVNDLDDDNDGIQDCVESNRSINNGVFGWYFNSPSGTVAMDNVYDPGINSWFLTQASNITFSGISASTPSSALQINNIPSSSYEEAFANDEYIEVSFTTAGDLANPVLQNINFGWYQPSGGNSYSLSARLSADGFTSSIPTVTDLAVVNDGATYQVFDLLDEPILPLNPNTTYTLRIYVYGQNNDGFSYSLFDDVNFTISSCEGINSDGDTVLDSYDLDSDNDGCSDANEAYNDRNADGGDGEAYGTGTPPATNPDGTVTAATYPAPADMDTNGTFDFQESGAAPNISVQPLDEKVFLPNNGSFGITESNTDNFQWQVSIDGGLVFNDISDGAEYTGTQTDVLTVLNPNLNKNGYIYRVRLTNDSFICGETFSNTAVLNVGPRSIITNRRITFRVNPN